MTGKEHQAGVIFGAAARKMRLVCLYTKVFAIDRPRPEYGA
jgi:hypothetical protein